MGNWIVEGVTKLSTGSKRGLALSPGGRQAGFSLWQVTQAKNSPTYIQMDQFWIGVKTAVAC